MSGPIELVWGDPYSSRRDVGWLHCPHCQTPTRLGWYADSLIVCTRCFVSFEMALGFLRLVALTAERSLGHLAVRMGGAC